MRIVWHHLLTPQQHSHERAAAIASDVSQHHAHAKTAAEAACVALAPRSVAGAQCVHIVHLYQFGAAPLPSRGRHRRRRRRRNRRRFMLFTTHNTSARRRRVSFAVALHIL